MKIYINFDREKISEKMYLKHNSTSRYSYVVSSEGYFIIKNNKINKIIVPEDDVYTKTIEDNILTIDNSKLYYQEYNKIPFKGSELEIEEKIFEFENVKLNVINDNIYYYECKNENDINKLYIEICNNILI